MRSMRKIIDYAQIARDYALLVSDASYLDMALYSKDNKKVSEERKKYAGKVLNQLEKIFGEKSDVPVELRGELISSEILDLIKEYCTRIQLGQNPKKTDGIYDIGLVTILTRGK